MRTCGGKGPWADGANSQLSGSLYPSTSHILHSPHPQVPHQFLVAPPCPGYLGPVPQTLNPNRGPLALLRMGVFGKGKPVKEANRIQPFPGCLPGAPRIIPLRPHKLQRAGRVSKLGFMGLMLFSAPHPSLSPLP
jgi:hypothetical protein